MSSKKARLPGMKSSNVNVRIRDELREKVEYAKLLPGGITHIVETALEELPIDRELLARLKALKK